MCTAATYKTTDFYFGRNLDFERSWGESVTITPRKYQIALRSGEVIRDHFAMIGMAHVRNGYPLYYDAVNEKGLCIAGLNSCRAPFTASVQTAKSAWLSSSSYLGCSRNALTSARRGRSYRASS